MKRRRIQDIGDVQTNVTATLKVIPKEEFRTSSQHWQLRWAKFIAAQGDYLKVTPVIKLIILGINSHISYILGLFFINLLKSNNRILRIISPSPILIS